jgi:hypothetical protein
MTEHQNHGIASHACTGEEQSGTSGVAPVKASRPKATHSGKLLGYAECYVLEDGRRMVSQRGVLAILRGKGVGNETGDLGKFLARLPSQFKYLAVGTRIEFELPTGGLALGREATELIDICQAYTEALASEELHPKQVPIAHRAMRFVNATGHRETESHGARLLRSSRAPLLPRPPTDRVRVRGRAGERRGTTKRRHRCVGRDAGKGPLKSRDLEAGPDVQMGMVGCGMRDTSSPAEELLHSAASASGKIDGARTLTPVAGDLPTRDLTETSSFHLQDFRLPLIPVSVGPHTE